MPIQTAIGKEFAAKVIPLIKQATKSIDIVVYNWYWYPEQISTDIQKFNTAIIQAAQRNVAVRVVTNAKRLCDILEKNRVQTKQWKHRKNLHTKLMIIDKTTAVLGSHNYTMNAFTVNLEVSVIFDDNKTMGILSDYFSSLW